MRIFNLPFSLKKKSESSFDCPRNVKKSEQKFLSGQRMVKKPGKNSCPDMSASMDFPETHNNYCIMSPPKTLFSYSDKLGLHGKEELVRHFQSSVFECESDDHVFVISTRFTDFFSVEACCEQETEERLLIRLSNPDCILRCVGWVTVQVRTHKLKSVSSS
ncbi:uncharacterized protein [Euphorbia lathyris]|uniref:uncharacterized protein n=1 Tax=Euphorbia lathyris TaxID=212925 RepID=UPI0033144D23